MRRRIAVLFHETDTLKSIRQFGVMGLAEVWREQGHEVRCLFGTGTRVEADLVFVHVDLSVVPDAYLEFAAEYPVSVNGRVKDIRKSAFSEQLLGPEDGWEGPVIVKSDRNYAGLPEAWRGVPRLDGSGLTPVFPSSMAYRIYAGLRAVPPAAFACPDLVVERFLPEEEDGLYHVRCYEFLGNREACVRNVSTHPIVKLATVVARESIQPHPDIVALRRRLDFDYGKFDYVERDGRAVILDLNKTTGMSPSAGPMLDADRRIRAEGLYAFLQEPGRG
ncbi:MAG: hypothetical protein IPL96_04200 [Holophagaceae bacterium]|nr:hypothetical protein [Holophagaceae bacterium]